LESPNQKQKRLAIITTHPIQYNAPLFKLLTEKNQISIKVFYTWGEDSIKQKFDPGFQRNIEWDIPLLEGYDYAMVENIAKNPGSHHYKGIINPTLNKEIEEWGADAILIYGWNFNSHLKCLQFFKGKIPIYFRGDSTMLSSGRNILKRFLRKYFLKWIYNKIDYAFYVGQANKKYFLEYGIKNESLFFAPHAIDNQRFASSGNNLIRKKLSISDSAVIYLFAGKLESIKNIELLINSFVISNSNNSYLLIVGNGKLEVSLKNQSKLLKTEIKNRIIFLDFVNQYEMPLLYNASDVFILPSLSETWGLSVNEAMAAGKAVIVSDKCGCYFDLVNEGINGYVFRSNNLDSLVSAMNKFTSREISNKMGLQSNEIISDWSFEKVTEEMHKAFIKTKLI
jgi:glycosyltransferase involved in cell wall biosynthesis